MTKVLLAFLMAFCLPAFAESQAGYGSAQARLFITVTVLPSMKVESVTPVPGGLEYRGFTNMKSATLGGTYVTFPTIGAFTVVVPSLSTADTRLQDGVSYEIVSSP